MLFYWRTKTRDYANLLTTSLSPYYLLKPETLFKFQLLALIADLAVRGLKSFMRTSEVKSKKKFFYSSLESENIKISDCKISIKKDDVSTRPLKLFIYLFLFHMEYSYWCKKFFAVPLPHLSWNVMICCENLQFYSRATYYSCVTLFYSYRSRVLKPISKNSVMNLLYLFKVLIMFHRFIRIYIVYPLIL